MQKVGKTFLSQKLKNIDKEAYILKNIKYITKGFDNIQFMRKKIKCNHLNGANTGQPIKCQVKEVYFCFSGSKK